MGFTYASDTISNRLRTFSSLPPPPTPLPLLPGRRNLDVLRPGIVGSQGSMVLRLRPCMIMSTRLSPPSPPPSLFPSPPPPPCFSGGIRGRTGGLLDLVILVGCGIPYPRCSFDNDRACGRRRVRLCRRGGGGGGGAAVHALRLEHGGCAIVLLRALGWVAVG